MKNKTIVHIDGNNFFVSCEVLRNPSLSGLPVCVLSNNDGCVVSRSYEAKKLGIPMGIPYFMSKTQFKGVVYLSADFALYHEISTRMMEFFSRYSDKVDCYSIDEAFLDVTGVEKVFHLTKLELVEKIKKEVEEEIGVKVSVGLSSSKTLAKLATHRAKQASGFYVIEKEDIKKELETLPIEEIWGVGKNISRSLKSFGIFNASDILKKEDEFFKFHFGKKGLELKYELMGFSIIPLTGELEKPKSIQRTRAFPQFSRDYNYIKEELLLHIHNVCNKLREYGLETIDIAVLLKTKEFQTYMLEDRLEFSSNSEIEISKYALRLFDFLYKKGVLYRSCGVLAFNLQDEEKNQLVLFENKESKKNEKIATLIDRVESKYGKGLLLAGNIGLKSVQKKHERELKHRSL